MQFTDTQKHATAFSLFEWGQVGTGDFGTSRLLSKAVEQKGDADPTGSTAWECMEAQEREDDAWCERTGARARLAGGSGATQRRRTKRRLAQASTMEAIKHGTSGDEQWESNGQKELGVTRPSTRRVCPHLNL